MRVLFDQVVETDYGQLDLVWDDGIGFDGDFERVFRGQVNGLAGAAHPGGLYLNLARRSGGSPVRIELGDDEPADDVSYQDVVEVSVVIPPNAVVRWQSWAGESGGTLTGLDAGEYRVRVGGRDRDQGHEGEFEDHPVDAYLIQFWPAPVAPDSITRAGSSEAARWHREVGSQR